MMAAEIIPIDRSDKELVKEEYTEAIRLWCQSRDTAEILTREEIGAMQKFDRVDAQRKAIILNLVHYYRKHERADVAPGLAVVITLLSDNDKGAASISQPTLAKLFGRSLSSIGDAIRRLKEDGIIVTGRGRFPLTHPVIPREVTRHQNHLVWLIEGACQSAQPHNLPVPSVDCQTTGPVRGLNQSTGPAGDLKKLNPPVEPVSIHRGDRCQIHYKNSTTLNKAAVVVAGVATALGILPAAADPPSPPALIEASGEIPYDDLKAKLMAAGGEALADTSAFEMLSLPRNWLRNGCSLEEDILPTMRARSAKMPPRSISSWNYFAQAVADAKAARLAPMPEGRAPPAAIQSPQRSFAQQKADAERAALARDVAEIRSRGPAKPLYEQIEDFLS